MKILNAEIIKYVKISINSFCIFLFLMFLKIILNFMQFN